jgi:hypothetical protein
VGNKSLSVACKWKKTQWLLEDQYLKQYVPNTELFNKYTLELMLDKYAVVYLKPSKGSGGKRIARIFHTPGGTYMVFKGLKKKKSFSSLERLYKHLQVFSRNKKYVLQRGISLEHTEGCPFDLRVMVQKRSNGDWSTTAVFAKVGKPGKVVNNYHQGGSLKGLQETLKGADYTDREVREMQRRLDEMGVQAGRCFDRYRDGFHELGLDVAVDRRGKLWILEVNTKPAIRPLKSFMNSRVYKRIVKLAKLYGRM